MIPSIFAITWRGDYACLRDITPEQVIAKIEGIID